MGGTAVSSGAKTLAKRNDSVQQKIMICIPAEESLETLMLLEARSRLHENLNPPESLVGDPGTSISLAFKESCRYC